MRSHSIVTIIFLTAVCLLASCDLKKVKRIEPDHIYSPFAPEGIKTAVRISPDGKRLGYLLDGALRVLDLKTTSSTAPVKSREGVVDWRWLSSRKLLIHSTDEGRARLAILDINTEQVNSLEVDEMKAFRYLAKNENGNEFMASIEFDDPSQSGIYRFDVFASKWTKEYDQGYSNWYFDADLNLVAASRHAGLYHYEAYVRKSDSSWEVIESPNEEWSSIGLDLGGILSVSGDGSHIYLMNNYNSDEVQLKSYDVQSGSATVMGAAPFCDLIWANAHLNGQNQPLAVSSYSALHQLHCVDPSVLDDYGFLFDKKNCNAQFVDASGSGDVWVVRYLLGVKMDYYLYFRSSKRLRFLFEDRETFRKYDPSIKKPLIAYGEDSIRLESQLIFSPEYDNNGDGLPDKPMPTIMFLHGGPWMGFYQYDPFYHLLFEFWASRGYAVVNAQFRSGVGFGRKYVEAGKRQWGGKIHSDILKVRAHVVSEGISDSLRVGVWGWSFGGYSTALALTLSPEKFTCGIAMNGLTDLYSFMKEKEEVFRNNGRWDWWCENLGDPNSSADSIQLTAYSPIHHAHKLRAPLLLVHGGKDSKAQPYHSQNLALKLKGLGKKVGYLRFPNEPHDYRKKRSWRALMLVAEQFFDRNLRAKAVAPVDVSDDAVWEFGRQLISDQ